MEGRRSAAAPSARQRSVWWTRAVPLEQHTHGVQFWALTRSCDGVAAAVWGVGGVDDWDFAGQGGRRACRRCTAAPQVSRMRDDPPRRARMQGTQGHPSFCAMYSSKCPRGEITHRGCSGSMCGIHRGRSQSRSCTSHRTTRRNTACPPTAMASASSAKGRENKQSAPWKRSKARERTSFCCALTPRSETSTTT